MTTPAYRHLTDGAYPLSGYVTNTGTRRSKVLSLLGYPRSPNAIVHVGVTEQNWEMALVVVTYP